MSLSILKIVKERKDTNQGNTKIWVGSIVTSKVREMEDNTMEVRIIIMSKGVVGCVQYGVTKNRFQIQLRDNQRREMSTFLFLLICDT